MIVVTSERTSPELAYRFAGDRFCRTERFAAYAAALGDRFVGRVLPDSAANNGECLMAYQSALVSSSDEKNPRFHCSVGPLCPNHRHNCCGNRLSLLRMDQLLAD